MPLISCCREPGANPPTTNPKIARSATRIGKIAVSVLNASPEAKFMTQSLLNLARNCLIGWASFSIFSMGLEEVIFSIASFGFDSLVRVAIITPHNHHKGFLLSCYCLHGLVRSDVPLQVL